MKGVLACLLAACLCVAYTSGLAVMSVDLGIEFMKIAIVKPGVPMEIALNKDSRRKTPVAVAFDNGDRLFGDAAMVKVVRYPKQAYLYLQDVLGKTKDNPGVARFERRLPHYTLEEDLDRKTVIFKHDEETQYTPEELMAMILETAKEVASDFAEQPVTDAVITVPSFFNQVERRAMLRAADLAGIKVLQLMNDNTAVALNYGVFRRKAFNQTAVNYMFFDMGAGSTTATVVSYQLAKTKNAVTERVETNPQLTIKGVGYDRTLGGIEFQLRLRDHLVKLFNEKKKTKSVVTENRRSMAKLYKEAGRLKHVLSANNDHFSQVEGLLDDEDFRAKVTRAEFEGLCDDLFQRISKTVEDAMKTSQLTWDEISEVILMGGATRMPKVQEMLMAATGRSELGRSINTDEAAAMGAVYQAAHLSKGFRVKPFHIKDAALFPIQVEFERVKSAEEGEAETHKTIKRTLFGRMNAFPQKKVMTFNKHYKDFNFAVNYGDLSFMDEAERKEFGSSELQKVSLSGIETAYDKHKDNKENKGVKAHFRMDDSGILTLDKVESVFELPPDAEPEVAEESTLQKLGNFFFGSSDKEGEQTEEGTAEEPKEEIKAEKDEASANKEKDEKTEKTEEKVEEKAEEKEEAKPESDEKPEESEVKDKKDDKNKTEEKKPAKPTIVKEDITMETTVLDLVDPSADEIKVSKKKLSDLRKRDQEKRKLEAAKNDLEAFIIDGQDRLYREQYEAASTETQRQEISEKFSAASDWLYEQDETTEKKAYEDKLGELKKLVQPLYDRVKEHEERPRAIEALRSVLNYSRHFMKNMKNFTGEDQPFTQIEYDTLSKMINDTKVWNRTMMAEQAKMPLHEKPKVTIEDIARKINDLDREVKYLINKAKVFKPKEKKEKKEKKTNETKTEEKTEAKNGDESVKLNETKAEDDTKAEEPTKEEETTETGQDTAAETEFKDPEKTEDGEDKHSKSKEKTETDEKEEPLQLDAAEADKPENKSEDKKEETKTSGHDPDDEL